ncbi:MAG: acyl-CoA dehydrogenase [archaeon]|nr:acyl-CoA dehydrogenase [archaeon]
MKLFALRAKDYIRTASPDDRRYLLYNPMVKMKVTTEGEKVMYLLFDVIAAKGFEKDTYFQTGAIAITSLPKLEGTVHVNMALIVKFMPKFFGIGGPGGIGGPHVEYPEIPKVIDDRNDAFLFNQGAAKNMMDISFHDYHIAYNQYDLPNVKTFLEQVETYKEMGTSAPPTLKQGDDIDFVMIAGHMFTMAVYGQLILENAKIYEMDDDLIEQVFDFMIRDFSMYALKLYSKPIAKKKQREYCLKMIKHPVKDNKRFERIRDRVYALKDTYEQNK